MAHAFFASYATLDNKSKWLGRVVDDLRERLRGRLGAADAAQVGFFAVYDGILTAKDWEQTLGEAARSARVIIPFCSNTYFNSEYCAKEFEIFRRRLAIAGAEHVDAIIPVIWDVCVLPKAVSRYQASHEAAFPRDYRQQGLLALRRNKTARSLYEKTVDALLTTIERVLNGQVLPPLPGSVVFDELPDTFDNPGAYNLRIGGLHRDGLRWALVPELGRSVARVVESVTSTQRLAWRALKVDDQIAEALEETERAREAVVLIADAASIEAGALAPRARAVDDLALPNCTVLVGLANENGQLPTPQSAQARLSSLFPKLLAAGRAGWFPLGSPDALEKYLAEQIVKLRMSLVNADPPEPVQDPALTRAALREGISIETRPVVSGPSGG